MATRTPAKNPEAIRINAIGAGVQPHEPDGSPNVGVGFWNVEPRTAPVAHWEDGETGLQKGLPKRLKDALFWRCPLGHPASADHDQHPSTVRLA